MMKKYNYIRLTYIAVTTIIFISARPLFQVDNDYRILLSGLLGALGAAIGVLFYKLVDKKKLFTQVIFICLLFIISIVLLRHYQNKQVTNNSLPNSYLNSLTSGIDKTLQRATYILTSTDKAKLKTCEICGYISFLPDSAFCYNCFNETWESVKGVYKVKEEWLTDLQEIYFEPDSINANIDFYKPDTVISVLNTFIKDSNWRPTVTKQMIIEYMKEKK